MIKQRNRLLRKGSGPSRRIHWCRRKYATLVWMVLFGTVCLWILTLMNQSVLRNTRERSTSALHSPLQKSALVSTSLSRLSVERRAKRKQAPTLESPSALRKAESLVSSRVSPSSAAQAIDQQADTSLRKAEPLVSPSSSGTQTINQQADKNKYHMVFSTSCSSKDWQSYLFFYLAMAHEQPGDVTHIVSGCKDQQQEDEIRLMHEEQHTKAMREDFYIHFTPEYSDRRNFQLTKYWNKPFGVKHWLEHRFGFEYDKSKEDVAKPTEFDDDIVILIDPDMLMLKPIHNNFTSAPKYVWNKYFQKHTDSLFYEVKQGQVIAQEYAFGASWLGALKGDGKNLTYVLGTTKSPVLEMSTFEAGNVYAAGPPYIATAKDFYKIAYHWTDFLPRYFEQKPMMMNEMYSYSMAAAHLGLKHQLAKGFMVSDVNILDGEGWEFMKETFPKDDDLVAHACDMPHYSQDSMPQVLHFCQRYGIGEFFISKYKVPRRTFTCEFPLYEEPPVDIAKELYTHMGNFQKTHWEAKNPMHTAKRAANAFMVCSLYSALNKAATFFKDHHCEPGKGNYDKRWQYFKVYDRDPHGPGGGGKSKSKP